MGDHHAEVESFATILKRFSHPKYWLTWFGLAILRLIVFLPLPVLALFGYVLGSLFYALHGSRRAIAFKNIRACFPEYTDAQCRKINWHQFCLLGQSVITISMNWWISPARFNRLVTIHGREHYDKALANGERIILLTPHFLSIEVSGLALQRERPMVGMYQYMKNPLINTIALRGRSRFCADGVMFERKAPLRSLLRILMKGLPMAYSPDQDAMKKGVFVPFFHTQASTTSALSKFINVTGSTVIPCRNKMRSWGRGYDVYLGEPVEGLASDDEVADTANMNKAIEEMVRQAPEQYLWVHKRFKTQPEGQPNFYK